MQFESNEDARAHYLEVIAGLIEDELFHFTADSVAYGEDGTIYFETADGYAFSLTLGPDPRGTEPGGDLTHPDEILRPDGYRAYDRGIEALRRYSAGETETPTYGIYPK